MDAPDKNNKKKDQYNVEKFLKHISDPQIKKIFKKNSHLFNIAFLRGLNPEDKSLKEFYQIIMNYFRTHFNLTENPFEINTPTDNSFINEDTFIRLGSIDDKIPAGIDLNQTTTNSNSTTCSNE